MEVLVSLGILGIITVSAVYLIIKYFQFNDQVSAKLVLQSEARSITEQMVNEFRKANQSSNGASAIEAADSDSIIFFSNIDADSYLERVRYFIDGINLKKDVIKPSGNPLTYDIETDTNTGNETISILSAHIDNGAADLFEYYDNTYNGSGLPLVFPVDKTQVKMVGINLILKGGTTSNPVSLSVSAKVNLRNLISN